MSSRKMPQRYLYAVHEESGITSTRLTCKKAKLDEVLAAHCRADVVTECMKKKKKLILSGDFSFSAENVNGISLSSAFWFMAEMKNAFRSASSIHHKKVLVLVLVLRCKVLVLVSNTRLGLGLERILKSWSWS